MHNAWTVSAVSASPAEFGPLMAGLFASARMEGIAEVEGLLPNDQLIYAACKAAGVNVDSDDQCHCVFERDLRGQGISNRPSYSLRT
jgi:hypothetical protein